MTRLLIFSLGRLKITTENGRNATTGEYDPIYTYGGRSFSVWRADDMSLVYDSGKMVAYQTSVLNPDLFNSNIGSISAAISSMVDSRSADKARIYEPHHEKTDVLFSDLIMLRSHLYRAPYDLFVYDFP